MSHIPKTHGENASLISDINKSYTVLLRAECDKMGIKNTYRLLLCALSENDGCTQLELVKKTKLKTSAVSVTLRKMEKEGLIVRYSGQDDLRKNYVFLTDSGKQLTGEIFERLDSLDRVLLTGFSSDESDILLSLLTKIKCNLAEKI